MWYIELALGEGARRLEAVGGCWNRFNELEEAAWPKMGVAGTFGKPGVMGLPEARLSMLVFEVAEVIWLPLRPLCSPSLSYLSLR